MLCLFCFLFFSSPRGPLLYLTSRCRGQIYWLRAPRDRRDSNFSRLSRVYRKINWFMRLRSSQVRPPARRVGASPRAVTERFRVRKHVRRARRGALLFQYRRKPNRPEPRAGTPKLAPLRILARHHTSGTKSRALGLPTRFHEFGLNLVSFIESKGGGLDILQRYNSRFFFSSFIFFFVTFHSPNFYPV